MYRVKEIFATLQGEGMLAGTPAVFVRLAGCNIWDGSEAGRSERNCSAWCDTDFVGGESLTLDQICDRVNDAMLHPPLVVLTGGEPMLQADDALLSALHGLGQLAIETNGTKMVPANWWGRAHITVSPKVAPAHLKQRCGAELKVVWPEYNPLDYEGLRANFTRLSMQPQWGVSHTDAADWCVEHGWALSLQMHKMVGLP